ncbi:MAG TPA: hypothetical protein VMM77_01845 [Gemmatimonadaceae bacterium]|nr:hypothetical protein [Gemmatimonadaceae bacterium]
MLRRLVVAFAVAPLFVACSEEEGPQAARGRGLEVAPIDAREHAQIYRAAVGAAFDVGPGLVLLLHPRFLPREAGLAGGDSVPAELARALRQAGTVAGTCEPGPVERGSLPQCDASAAGYIVRFSDVLQLSADSVQVYLDAEQYTVPAAPPQQVLRFEKAYQLVKENGRWRVAREGRVPAAVTDSQS